MEYSPMMLVMLWALTPSIEAAGAVPATVEEMSSPGMTVHQESYFTFNHGKPFLAEKDPVTGAILNLRTTPVSQDDYLYEEDEESDGIDRKDGPKIFTRNDIATPSKDPDIHKFLNLPVHYSSSGKFPLISSSYANMKVQGHNAASYPNHRPASTTSTSTVSPSYYPLKTSGTTSASTSTSTTTTTEATSKTTTTPTTTTSRPSKTTTLTTKPPPPSYEYEYEYDYDREQDSTDKKSTTQTILDFFEKDYAFLGNSEEEKNNNTKVEYILPSTNKNKEKVETVMVSSNTNLFIPPDYLKPSAKENKTDVLPGNKTTVFATTQKTLSASPSTPTKTVIVEATEAGKPMPSSINQESNMEFGMKITMKPTVVTTTAKTIETTKQTYKEHKVPFFPTIPTTGNTFIKRPIEESPANKEQTPLKQTTASPQEPRPTENNAAPQETRPSETTAAPVKPLQFHHPYLKPQDIYALQNRPNEQLRPYNPYQTSINSNVPPEMQPPKKPTEPTYYPRPDRPGSETFTYRPSDPIHFTHNRPSNSRPTEPMPNKPLDQHQEHQRPQYELRPSDLQQLMSGHIPQIQNRPTEVNPHDSKPLDVAITRPTAQSTSSGSTGSLTIPQNRPFEGASHKPENQIFHPPRPMNTRPTDNRYPPMYGSPHPQDFRPDQRPMPEYRPLPPRPEEMRPTIPQEVNVALGSRLPEYNKRPEVPQLNNNYQVQFTQPSKVENHFIKVSPGQENPSYSLQTSFSIGVPPPAEVKGQGSVSSPAIAPTVNQGLSKPGQGVGQVLFPDEEEKKPQPAARPWGFEDKRPSPAATEQEKYPRPPWETHIKPPLVFNHLKKEPYPFKRPKPTRPDLPNILPQFRPNAKIGHADPPYLKTPYDTLRPPPLPRPQFLRAEQPLADEEKPVHRRNGQTTLINPLPIQPIVQSQTSKRASLRSDDEKTDPVFVVYPSNNGQDGVVVGTRGAQRPLPPDNLDIEDSFPLDSNKNFQSRVDTPILKGKPTTKPPIKNDFPYPIIKPAEVIEEKSVSPIEKVTKEYTAFSPTVTPTDKEHDTEINVIPNLQDYMPFATKKPIYDPPKWNIGDDIKPISVTLKTHKVEETTLKTENHKTGDHPTPQDFQAPFHASLSAPSQGWSVVRPRPEPEKEDETTTVKVAEESEGKFDIQNFKPQLFGGFQPIIPPISEIEDKKPAKNEKEKQ